MDNNGANNHVERNPNRSMEAFERKARPILERLLIERFPSTFREMPDSFIHAVLEDVYTDSACSAGLHPLPIRGIMMNRASS